MLNKLRIVGERTWGDRFEDDSSALSKKIHHNSEDNSFPQRININGNGEYSVINK